MEHIQEQRLLSQSSSVIKSKMAATTIRTWTSFRSPKICVHCRLELSSLCLGLQLNSSLLFALPWWRCVCGYGTTIYQPFTFKHFVWKQSVNFSLHCTCQMYDYSMNDSKVAWISDDYFESFLLRKRKLEVQIVILRIRPSTEKQYDPETRRFCFYKKHGFYELKRNKKYRFSLFKLLLFFSLLTSSPLTALTASEGSCERTREERVFRVLLSHDVSPLSQVQSLLAGLVFLVKQAS